MTYKDNAIYVVPSEVKNDLLLDLSKEKELKNIKFLSLKELINNLTFSYDEKAIYFLMKNYNYKYENARIILDNLYYLENKKYNNKKLDNLVKINNEIKDLLIYNDYFKEYISNKKIIKNHHSSSHNVIHNQSSSDFNCYKKRINKSNKKTNIMNSRSPSPVQPQRSGIYNCYKKIRLIPIVRHRSIAFLIQVWYLSI